jgi:hypothetical protein
MGKMSTYRNEKMGKMLCQRNRIITKMLHSAPFCLGSSFKSCSGFFTKLVVKYYEQHLVSDFFLH